MAKWQWWWKDKRELEIWEKLNKLTPEQRADGKYSTLCQQKVKRYGNIYFFKPHAQSEAFMKDDHKIKILHGNNGSGKSYHAGADFVYELMGWSPYREVHTTKFARKVLWVFSPTKKTQRESSQDVLFALGEDYDTERDIGLLPRLEDIEAMGGKVIWENKKTQILDNVTMPDGITFYFKSMEMSLLSISASAVDLTWYDELPPQSKFDEGVARVMRKDGAVLMSCLVESAEDSYLVQDFYKRYEEDKRHERHTNFSFHFITIEGNTSLEISDLASRKRDVSLEGASWRFSAEGKFNLTPKGQRVWGNFFYGTHANFTGLMQGYDPMRCLNISWDIGRYAVIGFQADDWGTVNFLFSLYKKDVQLPDMIEHVDSYIATNLPDIMKQLHVLPHDANRQTKLTRTATSTKKIFEEDYSKNVEVIYVDAESCYEEGNKELKKMSDYGKAKYRFDPAYCEILIQALLLLTRDDKGKVKNIAPHKDLSDSFKLAVSFLAKHRLGRPIGSLIQERNAIVNIPNRGNVKHGRILSVGRFS